MDKKKKILVGSVGVFLTIVLTFLIKSIAFSNESDTGMVNGLNFDSPTVDTEKFDDATKKELYDNNQFDYDRDRYDSMADNLSFLQKMKEKITPNANNFNEEYEDAEDDQREMDEIDAQMQMLMAMQNDMNAVPQNQYGAVNQVQNEIPIRKLPKEGTYFFGATSGNKKTNTNLIPAEVIDQGFQKQGTTIAIRTKEEIIIPSSNIRIPKNAVIYGISRINESRLMIHINSYKRDNKLYNIDLDVYDFDGQQGIHLKNRTIFSIPSNVTKDVYKAAIQRYTQQTGALGGGNNDLNLEDIGNVSAISAAKEISREVFDRRRVFIPRKYHLWLTVNNNENGE